MEIAQLESKTLAELRSIARDYEVPRFSRLKKEDLIIGIMRMEAERQGHQLRGGVLDIMEDGVGFLRAENYLPGPNDIYVSQSQIKRFNMRTGDMVIGHVRQPKESEKYYGLLRVSAINGLNPDDLRQRENLNFIGTLGLGMLRRYLLGETTP